MIQSTHNKSPCTRDDLWGTLLTEQLAESISNQRQTAMFSYIVANRNEHVNRLMNLSSGEATSAMAEQSLTGTCLQITSKRNSWQDRLSPESQRHSTSMCRARNTGQRRSKNNTMKWWSGAREWPPRSWSRAASTPKQVSRMERHRWQSFLARISSP